MKLLFLGTGGGLEADRHASCLLVDGTVMVDCGPGALVQLRRAGRSPGDLEVLLVTHLHGDHTFGLPFLLTERAVLPRSGRRLLVAGPAGLEAHARALMALAFGEVDEALWERCGVDWVVLEPGEHRLGNLRVEAFPMEHPVSALGYRLDGRLGVTGDTGWGPGVEALARTPGALVVDWTSEKALPGHMGREDMVHLQALVPPGTRIFAVHRTVGAPGTGRPEAPPEGLHVPQDLEEVDLAP